MNHRLMFAVLFASLCGEAQAGNGRFIEGFRTELVAFGVPDPSAPSSPPPTPAAVVPTAAVKRIELDKERISFDDGDTISYVFLPAGGITGKEELLELRLLGFDTPETMHPHHGIFYDQPRGREASDLTRRLILAAGKIELVTRGQRDKYKRVLAHLLIDGENLAVIQIKAGLAYESVSPYGDNGFPDLAREIVGVWKADSPIYKALAAGREPAFIDPGRWRKINQWHDRAVPLDQWNNMSEEQRAAIVSEAAERAARNAGR